MIYIGFTVISAESGLLSKPADMRNEYSNLIIMALKWACIADVLPTQDVCITAKTNTVRFWWQAKLSLKIYITRAIHLSKSCWEVKDSLCRESVDCFPRLSWLRPGYITPYQYLGHLVHACGPMRSRLYAIGGEVVITSAVPLSLSLS